VLKAVRMLILILIHLKKLLEIRVKKLAKIPKISKVKMKIFRVKVNSRI
jgi:hypothetical protein